MGVYFSLFNSTWSENNQSMLLIKPIARDVYVSSCYTDFINNWVTKFWDHIDSFIWPNHMDTYSNFEGGDTYAYSGTTDPNPLSAMLHCG